MRRTFAADGQLGCTRSPCLERLNSRQRLAILGPNVLNMLRGAGVVIIHHMWATGVTSSDEDPVCL